jgi:hypothetical protein
MKTKNKEERNEIFYPLAGVTAPDARAWLEKPHSAGGGCLVLLSSSRGETVGHPRYLQIVLLSRRRKINGWNHRLAITRRRYRGWSPAKEEKKEGCAAAIRRRNQG